MDGSCMISGPKDIAIVTLRLNQADNSKPQSCCIHIRKYVLEALETLYVRIASYHIPPFSER